ncbi:MULTISPECIES: hypothetical protein [Bacillus cereus group]|uniref:Lipoprotein n=1 Tax=Bacillus cereus TaxID=1396 RepID=A0AA44Q8Z6_BACCE|nr:MULTISPECIES: hypothetical protein [Bacillus cereus group]PFA22881.1 hypothetical protein CN373_07285 [Bacillus cereus]PFN00475.1 hypothetical protein COJ55_24995 [Bacillus cereus]PFO80497.1 hypothetical protein COJ77_17095 [Bacillus cereus]PFR21174.1 hypothetical protein COK19_22195 [Bacillus cereus]PFR99386.1 hypothetical protein COK38_16075 [Bacillus cereus]
MFKKLSLLFVSGSLFMSLTACTPSYQKASAKNENSASMYTTKELQNEFPIEMPIDEYIAKKNTMNIKHPTSIPLPNGNVGRVLQATDGFVVICGNEKEIFNVLVFRTMDEVKEYETSLREK